LRRAGRSLVPRRPTRERSHGAAPAARLCLRMRAVLRAVIGRQRLRWRQAPSAVDGRQARLVLEGALTPPVRQPQRAAAAPGRQLVTAAKMQPRRQTRLPPRQLAPGYLSFSYEPASHGIHHSHRFDRKLNTNCSPWVRRWTSSKCYSTLRRAHDVILRGQGSNLGCEAVGGRETPRASSISAQGNTLVSSAQDPLSAEGAIHSPSFLRAEPGPDQACHVPPTLVSKPRMKAGSSAS
jgi:hypothetical protein